MSVNRELDRYQHELAQLVAIPSVSCSDKAWDMSNQKVVELLANWLEEAGFKCRLCSVKGFPGKFNLIATLGKGNEGLVLAGHSDTVPYDEKRWSSDAFTLTEKNDRLYGLGATDMKGFFPVALAAIRRIPPQSIKQPIILLATADEESSMSGVRALVDQDFPKAKFALIGEPTGMKPIHMHKGIMMESIRVLGKAGHSSNPALGINAIDIMSNIILSLKSYREELATRHQNPAFEVSIPTLNLGCIHGGDNPNRICSTCELHFDLRLMPGMHMEEIRASIRERLTPIADRCGADIIFSELFPGVPAFKQDAHSDLIQTVQTLTNYEAKSVGFATEAPFMQKMGIQTVVMGPGSIDQAHQSDEYISLTDIPAAINIIEYLIQHYCCT